jgi:cell division protein FtsW (lipid II flippase)
LKDSPINLPARLSIAAMMLLGLLGGTLIVACSGYETSPRRGGTPVFVPAPQAYIIAAAMYAMSFLAMLVLLREKTRSLMSAAVALAVYILAAWLLVKVVGPL